MYQIVAIRLLDFYLVEDVDSRDAENEGLSLVLQFKWLPQGIFWLVDGVKTPPQSCAFTSDVSVSAMQPCSASFNSLPLPREYNITNMTAAKRYESVWNAFLNELSHNPTATLTFFLKRCNVRQGRMKRWMENNGLSVKEAKKRLRDCRHDGIGDPMPPLSEDSGSLFLPMATDKPAPRSESCDILSGVSLTFPDGTQVNIKRGSAQAVMSFLKLYQREDLPCLD